MVIYEIRKDSVLTGGDATGWTRWLSLHRHAANFLNYRQGKPAVPHCLLTCGLQDFNSKGKTPNAIQNLPEGYIVIG